MNHNPNVPRTDNVIQVDTTLYDEIMTQIESAFVDRTRYNDLLITLRHTHRYIMDTLSTPHTDTDSTETYVTPIKAETTLRYVAEVLASVLVLHQSYRKG